MSNKQQVLSILVSGPVVNSGEFDDMTSCTGNEHYYSFNVNDYVHFYRDGNDGKIVNDNYDEDENVNRILLEFLHGYSSDADSNTVSRKLVELYRNELLQSLKN